jgi:hypothetical protein
MCWRLHQGFRWERFVRTVSVTSHSAGAPAILSTLELELREQRTLGDVLAWGRRHTPPRSVTEIVTQDEYTHDVVFAYDDAIYLVFDTT